MADELLPEEEQRQPEPSKNRFRDTARELGQQSYNTSRGGRDGLREALPRTTEAIDNMHRDRGLNATDFDDAFDKKGAGKQLEAIGKTAANIPKKSAQATSANIKRLSTLAKNKKWFAFGGGAAAMIIPIALFFMWMMLFKNVHIKNLYVTYRWAQFNRGVNKALKQQLEAQKTNPAEKPTGNADTTVSPTDAPEELNAKTNAEEFSPDKINPEDPAQIEAEGKKVTSLEQSVEGSSEKVLNDAGTSRSVKSAEGEGNTPEEKARSAEEKAKANVEEELAKDKDLGKNAPEGIKDGVEEAKKLEEAGKSAKEAAAQGADVVIEGTGGWKAAVRQATGPFVAATFFCIFRDIYVSAKEQVNKIVLSGAIGVSQELNKTADCQKMGKCDANQIGAVASRYDDGQESFTESCGYTRATQSSSPGCKEIDPQYVVNGVADAIGGAGGNAAKIFDKGLDNKPVDVACSAIMNSWVQAGAAIINLAAIVGTDGGWAAAGKAVGGGVAAAAGTAGGKALIANTIMTYGGSLFKDLTPSELGNITDMGNMATASASCAAAYCPQASDQDLAQLDREYRAERIAANSKRSVLEKFFDTESPDSVVARVALNTPSTPKAAMGRMKNLFATVTNPAKINLALGKNSLALSSKDTAYAADAGATTYGLTGKVNAPPILLPGAASYEEIVAWGKTADLASYSKYDKCADEAYATQVGADDNLCQWDGPMKGDGGRMYMQYKYVQNIAFKNALAHNKQSNVEGGGAAGGTGSAATSSTSGLVGKATKGQPCPPGAPSAGDATTIHGVQIGLCTVDGKPTNVSIAANLLNLIAKAKGDGVTITVGNSFRDYKEQVALREAHCGKSYYAIYQMPSSSCRPPTARPGTSRHEEGLAIDFDQYSFSWLKQHAAEFGLKNLPSESWHWSVDGQ